MFTGFEYIITNPKEYISNNKKVLKIINKVGEVAYNTISQYKGKTKARQDTAKYENLTEKEKEKYIKIALQTSF